MVTETRHTWLEALVAEERSSRLRYRRNATVPARAVRTGARQMSMGRMRAEMDRTRTLDRAAARAYKVRAKQGTCAGEHLRTECRSLRLHIVPDSS